MSGLSEVVQGHEGYQVADVETCGSGIEACVHGDLLALEQISQAFGALDDEPPLLQNRQHRFHLSPPIPRTPDRRRRILRRAEQ